MSLFLYEAINTQGKRVRGEVEADSESAARKKLKAQKLVPRRVEQGEKTGSAGVSRGFFRKLDADDELNFLQQLATLLEAGLPLSEALLSITEGMESQRARRAITLLRQQVLEGDSLAEGMRAQGFDEIVCNMIAAGEETGQMASVAARLASLIEHRQRLRQELLSAALYPMLVTVFGIVVVIFLLVVVIPQIVTVFAHAGGTLPWLTLALIRGSQFVRGNGLPILALLILLVLLYRLALRNPSFRMAKDKLLLRLPVVGGLLSKIETARFARSLGVLLSGGVPVLVSLHIAIQSVVMLPIRKTLLEAGEALREGEGLGGRLARDRYIPHMAARLIAVGEQSATLDAMLIRIANSFEEQGGRTLQRLVTLVEPLLVMLMALIVGGMALAILLPIMDMNELIR